MIAHRATMRAILPLTCSNQRLSMTDLPRCASSLTEAALRSRSADRAVEGGPVADEAEARQPSACWLMNASALERAKCFSLCRTCRISPAGTIERDGACNSAHHCTQDLRTSCRTVRMSRRNVRARREFVPSIRPEARALRLFVRCACSFARTIQLFVRAISPYVRTLWLLVRTIRLFARAFRQIVQTVRSEVRVIWHVTDDLLSVARRLRLFVHVVIQHDKTIRLFVRANLSDARAIRQMVRTLWQTMRTMLPEVRALSRSNVVICASDHRISRLTGAPPRVGRACRTGSGVFSPTNVGMESGALPVSRAAFAPSTKRVIHSALEPVSRSSDSRAARVSLRCISYTFMTCVITTVLAPTTTQLSDNQASGRLSHDEDASGACTGAVARPGISTRLRRLRSRSERGSAPSGTTGGSA